MSATSRKENAEFGTYVLLVILTLMLGAVLVVCAVPLASCLSCGGEGIFLVQKDDDASIFTTEKCGVCKGKGQAPLLKNWITRSKRIDQ